MPSSSLLPAFLVQALDWVQVHPVQGAISILLLAAFAVWLARKAMKVLVVLLAAGVVAILVSWFLVGEEETEKAIRLGAEQVVGKSQDLLNPEN